MDMRMKALLLFMALSYVSAESLKFELLPEHQYEECLFEDISAGQMLFTFGVRILGSESKMDARVIMSNPNGIEMHNKVYDDDNEQTHIVKVKLNTPGLHKICFSATNYRYVQMMFGNIATDLVKEERENTQNVKITKGDTEYSKSVIQQMSGRAQQISELLQMMRIRKNQHFRNFLRIDTRIYWSAISRCLGVALLCAIQIYIIQSWFKGTARARFGRV
eukprot:259029_1